ncbi:hypothetical protein LZ30DRAFT_702558 [Colletotrichum cereale]|nr:hypothetical protein LZ30DRAFT_702558 [Colletotrichum cereale]
MDGSSYNHGFRAPQHTNSSLSLETPTGAYKTNVKRTKTKKWVEAKTQNYDGDDWGNDYDDEPEDLAPIPPLRPTGSRSVSQSTTATLPTSNRSPAPQPVEPAHMPSMRVPQPTTDESGLSSGPRSTAGLPPLRIQNSAKPAPPVVQQLVSSDVKPPPIVSGAASVTSASEKAPNEQLVLPQSASGGAPQMAPSASLTGRPEYSQGTPLPSVRSRQTSPAPAQPSATRFPPRKSSMGQQDRDPQTSGSRSSSTQRPWIEQRPASPSNIRPPGTPSNPKSPPFIRPSDIYRRMDEDKDERGSAENGRPSRASDGVPISDRSGSPANSLTPSVGASDQQTARGSLDKGEGQGIPGADDTRQPILAPVAERKSEHGFDGILAQSLPQNSGSGPLSPSGSVQESSLVVPESQLQRPTAEESDQNRRYSTSPRLPDLARMSLFGDDFFTNPSRLDNEAPPVPSLPSTKQQPKAASVAENMPSMKKSAVTSPLSTSNPAPHSITATSATSAQVDRQKSPSPSQMPLVNEAAESSRSRLPSQSSRPPIPGGWVTETRSISDQQTPIVPKQNPMLCLDPGEVSPITDNEDEKTGKSGVAMVKDSVSIPVSIPEASERAAQGQSRTDWDADLTIPAPSNSRESGSSSSDFEAPEKLQRESTMSTITDPSPVKESDKLREEIMRSLSPVRPTSDSNHFSTSDTNQRLSPAIDDSGTRESTYLHGVYDDYWAAGDDKPDMPALPSKQPAPERGLVADQDISNVSPLSPRKDASDRSPSLSRRFSWEAGSEQVTPKPLDAQTDPLPEAVLSSGASTTHGASPPEQPHHEPRAALSELAREAEDTQSPTALDAAHIGVPQDPAAMSHQVSQVSSAPRDGMDTEATEPLSPLSVSTDKNSTPAAPVGRPSAAEEKSMARVASNPVSPSPPPGDHPALALAQAQPSEDLSPPTSPVTLQQQPAQPLKITTFKEIMDLASPSERINKYNETRAQFASMDSGLNNWLVTLKSQHPEHANATSSFGIGAPGPGQSQPSPTTSQPALQQPYYQQYLNASNPNLSAGASGRPPTSSAPSGSSHSPSSDFKHSSGQVGAKSKGLLLAAGKAGKGLLSKGKSKLRGTGDKNDSSPPRAQPKTRAERRTSWGLSLGARSSFHVDSLGHAHSRSLSGSVSGPAPQTIPEHPTDPTPPPQLPQTSRTPPFDSLTQGNGNQGSAWAPPPRPRTPEQPAGSHGDGGSEPVSPVSDTHSQSGPKSYVKVNDEDLRLGGDAWAPRPTGKAQPSWDPFINIPLVQDKGFEMGRSRDPSPHAPNAHQATQTQTATAPGNNPADDQYDDWVVVSPHSPPSGQIQVMSPQSPPLPSRSFQSTELAKDVTNGNIARPTANHIIHLHPQQGQQQTIQHLPSQQQQAGSPQRNSSFVGLPPIRRSSTFGINLTKRAKKRFSLDEDEDAHLVSSPVSNAADQHDHDAVTSSRLQQGESSWSAQSAQPARINTGPSNSRKDSGMSPGVFSATSTQAATLATDSTGVTGSDWRIDDEKRPLAPGAAFKGAGRVPQPIHTGANMQTDGRMDGPPYGPGMRSQQGMISPTFGGAGNPIHHLPPQGPWKLEESHLSEPLATSRSRQSGGSLSSQQQDFLGYEKETGVPPQAALRSETQLPPRQKFSEVPPSSAQRYPGLFSPPQWEQNPGSPTGPRRSHDLNQQYYGRDSTSLYRTQTGDSEFSTFDPSIDEERGRSRRSSGFFKEIGDRFSRESSHRRTASKAEEMATSIPAVPDVQANEVSEASVAMGEFQDRQRRRSSFFPNLRGSNPSDTGVPQGREGESIMQSPNASPNPGVFPQSRQLAGFADGKRSFVGPAGKESPSTLPIPNLSRSSTSTAENEAAGGAMGPPKKRFSGLTSKVFNRTSSQQDLQIPQRPGTSHSATSSMLGRPPGTPTNQPGVLGPLTRQGRERSETIGSGPYSGQQTMLKKQLQYVEEGDHGRRSSASGFLSGLFSKRAAPKHQEKQQSVSLMQDQNAQVPLQFRVQTPNHQGSPPNLGPAGQSEDQHLIRDLPQQSARQQQEQPQMSSFASQGPYGHPSAGTVFQLQPQAPLIHQQNSDGSLLPSPQASQQGRVIAETGARPVSDVGSDDQAAFSPPRSEAQNANISRKKPDQLSNGASHTEANQGVQTSQTQKEQRLLEPHRVSEQRQFYSSTQLHREQPAQPEQPNDQSQKPQVTPGFSAEPTPEPSIRHGKEPEPALGPLTPPLAHSYGGNTQALEIHGYGHARRISDQSASLLSPSSARAQSPNGVVGQAEISQHSFISNSPKPPATSQMQPPATGAASGRQIPPSGSFGGPPGTDIVGKVQHQVDRASQLLLNSMPQGQQQLPVVGESHPAQFTQMPPSSDQHSSLSFSSRNQIRQSQNPHGDGQQSSVSKWFRNRTSTQTAPSQSHQGHTKEPATKSIFSAFKRSSKQPEARPPQQQHMAHLGEAQPLQSRAQRLPIGQEQQRMPPSGPLTRRNPHPSQGHFPMYEQQCQSPSSMGVSGQQPFPQYDASLGSSDAGQDHGHISHHHRPTVDLPVTRAISPVHGPNHNVSQPQGFIEPQYDQVPIPQGYVAVHGEGGVAPSPYAIPRTSPPGQFLPHQVPPVQQWGPPPTAQRHPSEVSLYKQSGTAAPHVQHLPQSHVQPDTIPEGGGRISMASHQSNMPYASHNTQPGTGGPNGEPPMFSQHNGQQDPHQTESRDFQGQNDVGSQAQVHSDDNQVASQTAASLRPQSHTQTRGLAVDGGSIAGNNSRSASPSKQVATESVVSPEPPVPAPAASPLRVNVHKAIQDTPDDIYDSTPRLPLGPPPPPSQPIAATATGQSMVSDSSADEAPRNATRANGHAKGAISKTLARGKSTRAELEDTEDERRRTIRHEAHEEKILVDPYEELQSGGVKYRKEEDPEVPQMSATSYPGQEWNPYGAGGYEDWD